MGECARARVEVQSLPSRHRRVSRYALHPTRAASLAFYALSSQNALLCSSELDHIDVRTSHEVILSLEELDVQGERPGKKSKFDWVR